jgi:hypothetical protein
MSQLASLGAVCRRNVFAAASKSRIRSACASRRTLATAAATDDGALPLKGIRVLDMTRVLAGVSFVLRDVLGKSADEE